MTNHFPVCLACLVCFPRDQGRTAVSSLSAFFRTAGHKPGRGWFLQSLPKPRDRSRARSTLARRTFTRCLVAGFHALLSQRVSHKDLFRPPELRKEHAVVGLEAVGPAGPRIVRWCLSITASD